MSLAQLQPQLVLVFWSRSSFGRSDESVPRGYKYKPALSLIRVFFKDIVAENGESWRQKFKLEDFTHSRILLNAFEAAIVEVESISESDCQTPDLGQGLEFDFTFAMEQQQEPHLNFPG